MCIYELHYFPDCSQFDTGRWPSSINHSFVRSLMYRSFNSISHYTKTYITMNMDRHLKRIMTKFRFCVSELSVHYYRYRNHVEKDLKCPLCEQAKEDEVHFVLCCPMLDDIRKQFIPRSVNILVFLGLVCCWLQPTRKLSENYQFFCIRLSRLGILLLLSTNEPVVVNGCHLYDAKLNLFYSFFYGFVSNCMCTPS